MKKFLFFFIILTNICSIVGQNDTLIEYEDSIFCDELINYKGNPFDFTMLLTIDELEEIQIENIQGKDLVFVVFIAFDTTSEKKQNDTIFFTYDHIISISILNYFNNLSLFHFDERISDSAMPIEDKTLTDIVEMIEQYLSKLKYYAYPNNDFEQLKCSKSGTIITCISPSHFIR